MNDFAAFILTHGRAKNLVTIEALKRGGFTGKWYLILDNEDRTKEQYQQLFGAEKILIFNKKEYADKIDEGNNFDDRRATVHARNAAFDFAEKLGIDFFVLLEDDYENFEYRFPNKNNEKLIGIDIKNLDKIFQLHIDFLKKTPFTSVALAQNGDYIGGVNSPRIKDKKLIRKSMNSFFCSIRRKFSFVGQLNDDVNTYVTLGVRGHLFGTIPMISLKQIQTQKQKSGMTETYLKYGTYCKSFTTVMMHPSGVKVAMMNTSNPRIHHLIKWVNTVPVILSERYKKYEGSLS